MATHYSTWVTKTLLDVSVAKSEKPWESNMESNKVATAGKSVRIKLLAQKKSSYGETV